MIKNILYSLFLHSLLAVMIYANIRSQIATELPPGITVGVASLQSLQKPVKNKVIEEIKPTPSKPVPVEKKLTPKAEVKKEAPKKEIKPKAKASKPVSRPLIEEKKPEFKKEEEIKTEEKPKAETVEEKPVEIESKAENDKEIIEETEAVAAANNESIVENLENINLSAREKFNIQSQLKGCYRKIVGNNKDNDDLSLFVTVTVLKDGTIEFDEDKLINQERYNNPKDPKYRKKMDQIIQALEFCSPLRNMPLDKYDIWREFTIEFD